ncbi:family 78 glycoside hydrolase catalytic domain [Agromyces sp. G08B096]|uniref:Family 78 glycoside hydrolase catalytic domain n=1 Tax=Agromyces sp. G08B096 TaxID=3156399 RepID=A0AAU7W6H8_9MICO
MESPVAHRSGDLFPATARWIWHADEESPRNAWRCFRAEFIGSDPTARLRITGDSRYTVWVNGHRVGDGPVRGYVGQYRVDTWEIGHLLVEDGPNTVAVLVRHFGVPTFSHRRSRGGLLLAVEADGAGALLVSDGRWLSTAHRGQEPRSSRMSPQLAFTEVVDGRWEPGWHEADFRPGAGWTPVEVLGPEGTAPWGALAPRDIPALEERTVRPASVESLAFTTRHDFGATIDARNHFVPETEHHADVVAYAGYVATEIQLDAAATLEISLPFARSHVRVTAIGVDGRWSERDDLDHDPALGRSTRLDLDAGTHLLLIETSLTDHGYPLNLQLSADGGNLVVRAPSAHQSETPFVAWTVAVAEADPARALAHPPVEAPPLPAGSRARASELVSGGATPGPGEEPVRAIAAAHVSPASVYGDNVHPRSRSTVLPPRSLSALCSAQAAWLPHREGLDAEVVFDLGEEVSGYYEFELTAPEGAVVDVYGFEYLHEGWREDTIGCDNTLRYTTREGRQRYRSEVRHGARYVQLTVRDASAPVLVHEIGVVAAHYPVSRTGRFEASDRLLVDAWELSRRTLITCMEDTFVDCPIYEQAFWVGDSYSSSRFASAMFDADALIERCLRLVAGSEAQTPLLTSQVPSGWTNVIPNWTFLWVIAVRDHWFRTGDAAFAAELLPAVTRTLDAFDAYRDERGLLSIDAWNFLDWAKLDHDNSGVVGHQNMLFVMAWDAAAALAAALGDAGSAERLTARAEEQRAIVVRELWDDGAGAYLDSIAVDGTRSNGFSQQTQLFALLAGAGDADRLDRLQDLVVEPPAGWVRIASPWLAIFLYDVLAGRGRTDLAVADLREKYGMMLEQGAVTCWETYPGSTMSNVDRVTRSHCHAWSAAPASFLPERVLGIQPLEPGFARVRIDPFAGDLDWARGRVPLPAGGELSVSWARADDGGLDVEVVAPAGVDLEFAPGLRPSVQRIPTA